MNIRRRADLIERGIGTARIKTDDHFEPVRVVSRAQTIGNALANGVRVIARGDDASAVPS